MNTPQANNNIRFLLIASGLVLLLLSIGFLLGMPQVLALWPWEDGRLSYVFIASILAAIGAPVIWIGYHSELAAMRAGALDLATTYLALSLALVLVNNMSEMLPAGLLQPLLVICVLSMLFNFVLYFLVRKYDFQSTRHTPKGVRWSFLVFAVLLLVVGSALISVYPYVFPWPLKPQSSIVFGCIFLGAAVYFLHGLMYPLWSNACGQLIGFLAYDLVLIVPFIQHFQTVKPAHYPSLVVYTAVVIFSLLLSIYYLFFNPHTRFGATRHRQRT